MSRGRVYNHMFRLIDNQDITVLIQNIERNVLRRDIRLHTFRQRKSHLVSILYPAACLYGLPIYKTFFAGYHFLDIGAG